MQIKEFRSHQLLTKYREILEKNDYQIRALGALSANPGTSGSRLIRIKEIQKQLDASIEEEKRLGLFCRELIDKLPRRSAGRGKQWQLLRLLYIDGLSYTEAVTAMFEDADDFEVCYDKYKTAFFQTYRRALHNLDLILDKQDAVPDTAGHSHE